MFSFAGYVAGEPPGTLKKSEITVPMTTLNCFLYKVHPRRKIRIDSHLLLPAYS